MGTTKRICTGCNINVLARNEEICYSCQRALDTYNKQTPYEELEGEEGKRKGKALKKSEQGKKTNGHT